MQQAAEYENRNIEEILGECYENIMRISLEYYELVAL